MLAGYSGSSTNHDFTLARYNPDGSLDPSFGVNGIVISEFGRTFKENGNRGTDHGHGSTHWVLGGGIAGGRIAGEQQPVSSATLLDHRDLPVLNDYRAVLGGLFARLWGLSPKRLDNVFPQAARTDLKLV